MIKKNIGFINSPAEFLTDQRVFVSLGILRVATQLKDKHNIKFLDLSNQTNYFDLISNFIKTNELEVLCFSATTPQISLVLKFCKFIKENFKIKIILGGPHITLMHNSGKSGTSDINKICEDHISKLLNYIDVIVIGDGEYAIEDALITNDTIINSELNKKLYLPKNYDDVAIPDRDFIDLDSYHYTIDGKKSTNLISQMGCPYQCEFCSGRGSTTFNRIRKRSIENIIKEIDILHKKYNYEGFMFYDDEINLNKTYFENFLIELIKYQKDNKVNFNLRGFTRSDLIDNEQANLMYDAGFRWLLIGFESGSDRILKNINKGCTVEDNTNSFEIARNNNLKVKALMSVGHPGESQDSINETKSWLNKVKPDETDITIVSVYPGSFYFNKSILTNNNNLLYESSKTGDKLYIDNIDFLKESNFYKSKSNEYSSFVYTDFLSKKQLITNRNNLEKISKF